MFWSITCSLILPRRPSSIFLRVCLSDSDIPITCIGKLERILHISKLPKSWQSINSSRSITTTELLRFSFPRTSRFELGYFPLRSKGFDIPLPKKKRISTSLPNSLTIASDLRRSCSQSLSLIIGLIPYGISKMFSSIFVQSEAHLLEASSNDRRILLKSK